MRRINNTVSPPRRARKSGEFRPAGSRHSRPSFEILEDRIVLSIGGGWISSTQSGQPGEGLLGQYYNNATLSGAPTFTRWDNQVDFDWTENNAYPGGAPGPAFGSVGPNNWSAKWTGEFAANFSETYTFTINSAAHGIRLWVAPVGHPSIAPLINDWTNHGQTTDSATMALQAGQDYTVELDLSETTASQQQVQLQWSSPSTPLQDIGPETDVGLNMDGGDNLFANMVNGGTRNTWWAPFTNTPVPTDSNYWPNEDAQVLLGEGDTTTMAGGSYQVQFTGMATVIEWPNSVDWIVNGTDLHTSTLQAGVGYNAATNTTTATMVAQPNSNPGFYLNFLNTDRNPHSATGITGISDTNGTVTVSLPSVNGITTNQRATIAGFTGSAAVYNGTYTITGVNTTNNTFTYTGSAWSGPTNPGGGTALVNPENGITNLYVMQPSTLGGSTPIPVGTLFTPAALALASQYTTLRLMNLNSTNGNLTSNWSDRSLVSDNFWSDYTFNSGTGVDTGVSGGAPLAGAPYEVQVALANESGKDVYITIPINASASYLTNLANLFAFGSDGTNPYTSVQSNPVWKPLDGNLKVFIEFSNETWNSGFTQAESRSDGWANQLSQRALFDYLTNNQNDSLYPGGGSSAYNDGAILASYYAVTASNDSQFLATFNASPGQSTDGGSPGYFNNSASINGYSIGQGWIGLRDVQVSNAFKTAFGETAVDAVDPDSRVRPVFEWQYGGNWTGALGLISGVYGAQHPVNYYLFGGGGGWYSPDGKNGFTDVSFTNPAFANGLTGWTATGAAGVAANGSAMGNPNAPPLFAAIAITNGATESGNSVTITTAQPHNFVTGQSVTISGVNVGGYNGTFTITSVTSTTFTYQDTSTGLRNAGTGMVTGNGPSAQTAYLQPGASLSQNVTFSGGYADITLYATQNVPFNGLYGLTITLTPTNGGPAINGGQPIPASEGAPNYSGQQNAFAWARTEAFYTGAQPYTYTIKLKSTYPSGTIFFDNVAIQTVNGMFNETAGSTWAIKYEIQSDVSLALQYGLSDVGYEGGFYFGQNMSGYLDLNGYRDMGSAGYSSGVPNVGAYANTDPRAESLAIQTLDQFYAAGGTLPIVYESTGNINSWAVAAPNYFNWNTSKALAASSVEQALQPVTYGKAPGQSVTSNSSWLYPGQNVGAVYLLPAGGYEATLSFVGNGGTPTGQTDSVAVLVDGQVINTVNVSITYGGTFNVILGGFAAGQYWVELLNTAPAVNPPLSLSSPGTPIFTVNNATTVLTWNVPGVMDYGTPLSSTQLDATANVPGTFTYSPAAGTILGLGIQTLTVSFVPTDSTYFPRATATVTIDVELPSVATFAYEDTTTQGTWIGVYGAQGYDVIANAASFPAYATVTPSGQSLHTWASNTTDPRALQDAVGTGRIAAGWISTTSFTVNINLTDRQTHDLALYFLDWDTTSRSDQVQITNAVTGAVLSTQQVSSFHNGVYLVYAVSGDILITFTKTGSAQAVLSGLFLDPVPAPAVPTAALGQGSTTQGSWTETSGAHGDDMIANSASLPGHATVTPSGQSSWTWVSKTNDTRDGNGDAASIVVGQDENADAASIVAAHWNWGRKRGRS